MGYVELPIQILGRVLVQLLKEAIDRLALTFGFVEIGLEFWFQLKFLSYKAKLRQGAVLSQRFPRLDSKHQKNEYPEK